jgi:hypothetical protein
LSNNIDEPDPEGRQSPTNRSGRSLSNATSVAVTDNSTAAPAQLPSPVHRPSAGSSLRSVLLNVAQQLPEQSEVIGNSIHSVSTREESHDIQRSVPATSNLMTLRSGSNVDLEQSVEEGKPSTSLRNQSAFEKKNWPNDGEAQQRRTLAEIKTDVGIHKLHAKSIESLQIDLIQVLEKLVRLKPEIKDGAMDAWHETAVSVLDENTVQNMVFMPQLGKQIGRISLLLSMDDDVSHPEQLIDLFTALDTAMVCITEEGRNRQFLSESAVEKLVSLVSDHELTPAQTIKACEIIDRNLHAVSADSLIELESQLAEKEASGPEAPVVENLQSRLMQLCLSNYAMLDESDQRRALEIFCSDVQTLKGMGSVPDIQDGLLHKLESLAKAKKDIKQEVMQDWYKAALSVFDGDTAQHMVPRHGIRIHVNSILRCLKIDDRDGCIHAADMIELYGRLDELLDIGSHVFRSNNFLHDTHLLRIADAACAPALDRQQIEVACRLIDKNVYIASDETSVGLLEKLDRIQSFQSSGTAISSPWRQSTT